MWYMVPGKDGDILKVMFRVFKHVQLRKIYYDCDRKGRKLGSMRHLDDFSTSSSR